MSDLSKILKGKLNSKTNLTNILTAIHTLQMENTHPADGDYRIYFDGEYDGNQTDFERASNNLKIGVISNNSLCGYALLWFVRLIIDSNKDCLDIITDYIEDDSLPSTIMNILTTMKNKAADSGINFAINETFEVTLLGCENSGMYEKTIMKKLWEVDVWTLERIATNLNIKYL